MIFIDTNVAIDLRDDIGGSWVRLEALGDLPVMSMFTRIELEAGVERAAEDSVIRRQALNVVLRTVAVIPVSDDDVAAYGRTVRAAGFNRVRVFDRLIAAQVVTRNATLVTANHADFADIPGLALIPW